MIINKKMKTIKKYLLEFNLCIEQNCSIIYRGLLFVIWNHTVEYKLFVLDRNTW